MFFFANLKHVYFIINLHENNCYLFVFIIFNIKQLQFIRMLQKFKSTDFTMTEIVNQAFEKFFIQNEFSFKFSFLHFFNLFQFSNLCFYMNNFFEIQFADFFFISISKKNYCLS